MKKIVFSLLFLLLAASVARAVPADPKPYKYTQPDGSVIVLQNHGDEFFHWTTDSAGNIVEKGADGFYRVSKTNFAAAAAEGARRRAQQNRVWSSFDNPPETNFGDRKVLCIIANFTDSTFVVSNPKQHFSNMLNQVGYSENGAIGSVRDYYLDNSWNGTESLYRPQFDVYGPVNLTKSSAYYKANGVHLAILEAYELLKSEINIADYDTDGDGNVDMVLFYYPGHNQAEGAGAESIWPHQSSGYFGAMGSKNFVRYFCTSELRGSSGNTPAAIGTTCHEFAHSLGLPDFYDTDYDENGRNSYTTGEFDLMSGGNYNDGGRRPPYLNAVERNMLGWMDYPTAIISSGNFTLGPVQTNQAYQFASAVTGEYFVLESRNGYKWDSTLPSGLLVYHIDKSDRLVGGGLTAGQLWANTNKINVYGGHPCFYMVPTLSSWSYLNQLVFPGYNNVTTYIPTDWDDNPAGLSMTAIAHDGTKSSFTVNFTSLRSVFGTVCDSAGNPLEGVQVSLTQSDVPFAGAPSLISGSLFCTTGADGTYRFELEDSASNYQIVRAEKSGYVSTSRNVTLAGLFNEQDILLLHLGEGAPGELIKYDLSGGMAFFQFGGSDPYAFGIRYTAEELVAMDAVGASISSITFMAGAENGEKVYVVVDIPGETSYRLDVTDQYGANTFTTIDISAANIVIPAGKDVFIGYGLTGIATGYPFPFIFNTTDNGGSYYLPDFLTSSSWSNLGQQSGSYWNAIVSASIQRTADVDFAAHGVSYIKVVSDVPTVVVAAGKSLRDITWYVDGTAVASPTPVSALAAGSHTYQARVRFYDGTSERIFYDIDK